jgi:hypothetical protein
MDVGSARYGAKMAPNAFSVVRLVEPTRMGTRGGKAAGLAKCLCTSAQLV